MANPNPSPETRFKPGHALGGKTAEQRRFEYEAAEIAAKARHKLVSIIGKALEKDGIEQEEALKLLTPDILRLFKDSEDRAHGTPRQSVEHSGSVDHKHTARNMTDDELAAYLRNDTDQG